MKFLIFVALMPTAALAQVNLCVDDQGRKTYTEAECNEIGMQPIGVIADIKPKPQRCYDLADRMKSQQEQAEKIRKNNNMLNTNAAVAVLLESQAEQTERQYMKECKR